MDERRFEEALSRALAGRSATGGIGTLGEKTLHAALKYYLEPDTVFHEVKFAGYIADILRGEDIFEIQTRGFHRLCPKLAAFLPEKRVTVVCPIAVNTEIVWHEPATGAVAAVRRSSKHGKAVSLLSELYRIKPFLMHPNLRLRIFLLDAQDHRLLDGYGVQKKKRATKVDRIPTALLGEASIECAADYRYFLPEKLPVVFDAGDFCRAAGIPRRTAQTALNVLHHLGVVERASKRGRAFEYRVRDEKGAADSMLS